MDNIIAQMQQLFNSALRWASPAGYGITPTVGTAVNTGEAFDAAQAMAQFQGSGDWFGAMQGSFNASNQFLADTFARQEQFAAPFYAAIISSGDRLAAYSLETQRQIGRRSTKRGLLSKLF